MPTTRAKPTKPRKPKYEPVLDLPPLSNEDFEALRSNIGVNGVLVPIIVDSDGLRRKIIDGNYRKLLADEFGYECPEIVPDGLTEEEKRTLARALNLARRQLTQDQKRQLVADQLRETPQISNRQVGKNLGVHHATVATVREGLVSTGQIDHFDRTLGADGKLRKIVRQYAEVIRPPAEHKQRLAATALIHGDCVKELKKLPKNSVDAVITDPVYPEVKREYGRMGEAEWLEMMKNVVRESRRVLRPKGSAVFILQPNYEKIGQMRLWLWEFVVWAGREWNLVQDCWWWAVDAMPLAGASRKYGLMRQSVKMCVWLGEPDCYRNQDAVLLTPSEATSGRRRTDVRVRSGPSGRSFRHATIAQVAAERGGTTPFNLLPIATGGQPAGREDHPAVTPYDLATWWCRYILPENGVLLDPFVGSGTMLAAGLDNAASKVIGIDKQRKYLEIAKRRVVR